MVRTGFSEEVAADVDPHEASGFPRVAPETFRIHPDPERNSEMWSQVRERVAYYKRNEKTLARLAAEAVVQCLLSERARARIAAATEEDNPTKLNRG